MSRESFPDQNPDFDDFLSQLDEHQVQSAESAARNELITHQINEALVKHGVETVFNADFTIDLEKERELFEGLTDQLQESFSESGEYIDRGEAADRAEVYLKSLEMEQMALLAKVRMLLVAFEDVSQAVKSAHKHELIAEWIIRQNYELDSSWVHFLNEVLPGEDFSGENADEYLHRAILKEAEAEESGKKIISATEKAIERTGKELTLDRVSELAMLALRRDESYEMQSRIDETARKVGLTTDEGRLFVETLRSELDADQQSE